MLFTLGYQLSPFPFFVVGMNVGGGWGESIVDGKVDKRFGVFYGDFKLGSYGARRVCQWLNWSVVTRICLMIAIQSIDIIYDNDV